MFEKRFKYGFHSGWHVARWIFLGIVGASVFALVFGFLVMYLWNWLMPMIFGLNTITYLQAFGLVVLSKILFGSFGHGHGHEKSDRRYRLMIKKGSDRDDVVPSEILEHRDEFDRFWKESGRGHFEEYMKQVDDGE
ncbi:MAG: hypothetical protein JXA20_16270 [Spirochaetes bacterium]|nr:hypothetical protein [Spirochaetota bacterium]